jgi:hypothetical protein
MRGVPSCARDCALYQWSRHRVLQIAFGPGDYAASLTVWIMDDMCYEHEMEYFVVQLSLPGGAALLGEGYAATVRIDDDDAALGRQYCRNDP